MTEPTPPAAPTAPAAPTPEPADASGRRTFKAIATDPTLDETARGQEINDRITRIRDIYMGEPQADGTFGSSKYKGGFVAADVEFLLIALTQTSALVGQLQNALRMVAQPAPPSSPLIALPGDPAFNAIARRR